MTLKELFEKHGPDCVFIEEYVHNKLHAEHFSFGFRDTEKSLIYLNRDGNGAVTTLDSTQEARLDKDNHEFVLAVDDGDIDIKLRFIKKIAHRFLTQKEIDNREEINKELVT